MTRPQVTALVTSLNEVEQISDCLATLAWVDELFLVDSFSTDGTVELVRERFPHVRIEQHRYLGAAAQKNWAMDRASHDWILVLDADERITAALQSEIERVLENPACHAYSIGRRNWVLGREVRYSGLQRDRVKRLFDRRHARYPNRRVHADLEVSGCVGDLRAKMIHYYVRSFDHMREKMTRYGHWGATQMFLTGRRGTARDILVHTASRFFRDLIGNRGFMDGARGLAVVGMHVYYTFWKYLLLWEYTELERQGKPVPLAEVEEAEDTWQRPWLDEPKTEKLKG